MKNLIHIDVDTERERQILITKGENIEPPKNKDEAREMVLLDMGCVCEALIRLIDLADNSGYSKKEDMVLNVKKQLDIYLEGNGEQN